MVGDAGRGAHGERLPADGVFEALANRRRRLAVACVDEYGPAVSLLDLAEEVAVREFERPISRVDEREVRRVYLSLRHVHVPMLTESDVLAYEPSRELVWIAGNADQVVPLARVEFGDEDTTGERPVDR